MNDAVKPEISWQDFEKLKSECNKKYCAYIILNLDEYIKFTR